jgi:hypothetical protein
MQDPMWIRGLLGVHVAAGTVSFVMAPPALAMAKGGRAHRRWGKGVLRAGRFWFQRSSERSDLVGQYIEIAD